MHIMHLRVRFPQPLSSAIIYITAGLVINIINMLRVLTQMRKRN